MIGGVDDDALQAWDTNAEKEYVWQCGVGMNKSMVLWWREYGRGPGW